MDIGWRAHKAVMDGVADAAPYEEATKYVVKRVETAMNQLRQDTLEQVFEAIQGFQRDFNKEWRVQLADAIREISKN